MNADPLSRTELIVLCIAETAVQNEQYFTELDSVVGDGDFGFSLARGFEKLLEGWDELQYADASGLLSQSASIISERVGGTSGPIWSTAFRRAARVLADNSTPNANDVVAALRAAAEGIKERGKAEVGDKTLVDAFVPAVDLLALELGRGCDTSEAIAAAAAAARRAAEGTRGMLAKRGRASYAGERSRDSVDAGAMAVAVLFEAVSESWCA